MTDAAQLDIFAAPLPDPARPMRGRVHRDAHATELEAAARVAPRSGTQRARVLELLRDAGTLGLTDYELWQAGVGARPHVPGTRREELIADGWPIIATDERRPTDTGSPAIVWRFER